MAENTASDGFLNKAIEAIPKWALGILGIIIGVVITFQFAGYNNAVIRIVESTAKRYEQSAQSFENSAARFEKLTAQLDTLDNRVTRIERRLDATDAKYHTR